ncbi:hypothetical protein BGZ76_010683 [Entomortierella beljakovae]|nr:hypothetical protein BGZ76_010683 [Entomortierella beljakovae]
MVLSFPQLRSLSINCCNEQDLKWLSILKGLCFLEGFTFTSDDFSIRYRKYDFSSENVENHSLASESDYSTGEDDEEEDIIELELGFHGAEEVEDEDHSQDSEYEALEFATSEISDGDLSEMNDMDHLGDFLVARASTLKKLNMEGEKLGGFILFENWRKTEDSDSTNILLPNPSIPLLGLTELNISKTYILQPQHVVEPLLLQCPNLEKLNISSNFDRNWYRFNWSILHTSCLKLTSLNISEIEFIDNDQLVLVIKKCLGLCSLIAFNSNVSDIVLGAIMERQITMAAENIEDSEQKQETKPFLELDISWCMKISQRAIEKFLQQISSLEILKISWCSRIDLTIFQSQWACLNLKILEAQGLENPSIFKGTLERTMFEKISQFEYLERLVIGSNEVEISVAKGFDLIGNEGLPHLEHLELLGREENPFEPPELTVLKKGFPKLKRFHFGMGLVTPDHQDWLRRIRPDMKVEEDEVYF